MASGDGGLPLYPLHGQKREDEYGANVDVEEEKGAYAGCQPAESASPKRVEEKKRKLNGKSRKPVSPGPAPGAGPLRVLRALQRVATGRGMAKDRIKKESKRQGKQKKTLKKVVESKARK